MRDKLFSLIFLVLFVCGLTILFMPHNEYSKTEKRELLTLNDIGINDIKKIDSVLKDQFFARDVLTTNFYKFKLMLNDVFYKNDNIKYLSKEIIDVGDGYLTNEIKTYNESLNDISGKRGYNFNELSEKYQDIKFYVYFPTRIEEILYADFNYFPKYKENFTINLNEKIKTKALYYESIEDYKNLFYKTDFHWNNKGAYQGYVDIVEMINEDFDIGEPKSIENEVCYPYGFKGNISSKISMIGEYDYICDYTLNDIGDYDYYVNGIKTDINKDKELYSQNGNNTFYSDYDIYFGNNSYERIFEFNNENKPSILIFADSFINVNQEWLASHFDNTIIIDLRANDGTFSFEYYKEKYGIDIVLMTQMYTNLYFNGQMFVPIEY